MDDYSIPDWNAVNPEVMKTWGEGKLFFVMAQNRGGVYDTWARTELTRRQTERLETFISQLGAETEKVHREVAILASSSDRVERLTKNLRSLTIWLIVFAFIQLLVAGLQTWRMFEPGPPVQIILPPH